MRSRDGVECNVSEPRFAAVAAVVVVVVMRQTKGNGTKLAEGAAAAAAAVAEAQVFHRKKKKSLYFVAVAAAEECVLRGKECFSSVISAAAAVAQPSRRKISVDSAIAANAAAAPATARLVRSKHLMRRYVGRSAAIVHLGHFDKGDGAVPFAAAAVHAYFPAAAAAVSHPSQDRTVTFPISFATAAPAAQQHQAAPADADRSVDSRGFAGHGLVNCGRAVSSMSSSSASSYPSYSFSSSDTSSSWCSSPPPLNSSACSSSAFSSSPSSNGSPSSSSSFRSLLPVSSSSSYLFPFLGGEKSFWSRHHLLPLSHSREYSAGLLQKARFLLLTIFFLFFSSLRFASQSFSPLPSPAPVAAAPFLSTAAPASAPAAASLQPWHAAAAARPTAPSLAVALLHAGPVLALGTPRVAAAPQSAAAAAAKSLGRAPAPAHLPSAAATLLESPADQMPLSTTAAALAASPLSGDRGVLHVRPQHLWTSGKSSLRCICVQQSSPFFVRAGAVTSSPTYPCRAAVLPSLESFNVNAEQTRHSHASQSAAASAAAAAAVVFATSAAPAPAAASATSTAAAAASTSSAATAAMPSAPALTQRATSDLLQPFFPLLLLSSRQMRAAHSLSSTSESQQPQHVTQARSCMRECSPYLSIVIIKPLAAALVPTIYAPSSFLHLFVRADQFFSKILNAKTQRGLPSVRLRLLSRDASSSLYPYLSSSFALPSSSPPLFACHMLSHSPLGTAFLGHTDSRRRPNSSAGSLVEREEIRSKKASPCVLHHSASLYCCSPFSHCLSAARRRHIRARQQPEKSRRTNSSTALPSLAALLVSSPAPSSYSFSVEERVRVPTPAALTSSARKSTNNLLSPASLTPSCRALVSSSSLSRSPRGNPVAFLPSLQPRCTGRVKITKPTNAALCPCCFRQRIELPCPMLAAAAATIGRKRGKESCATQQQLMLTDLKGKNETMLSHMRLSGGGRCNGRPSSCTSRSSSSSRSWLHECMLQQAGLCSSTSSREETGSNCRRSNCRQHMLWALPPRRRGRIHDSNVKRGNEGIATGEACRDARVRSRPTWLQRAAAAAVYSVPYIELFHTFLPWLTSLLPSMAPVWERVGRVLELYTRIPCSNLLTFAAPYTFIVKKKTFFKPSYFLRHHTMTALLLSMLQYTISMIYFKGVRGSFAVGSSTIHETVVLSLFLSVHTLLFNAVCHALAGEYAWIPVVTEAVNMHIGDSPLDGRKSTDGGE